MESNNIIDRFGRVIDYLRISVTDRCNLRCIYCMPSNGLKLYPAKEILRLEEVARLVRVMASMGIRKVKITGGEPLIRGGILTLFNYLGEIPGIEDVSLTTNGVLLKEYAADLARSGCRRVTVSLDTLKESRYRQITRGGNLNDVLRGIESCLDNGLTPLKMNVVVIKGINEDEIEDFIKLTYQLPIHVRFIEYMYMLEGKENSRFVSLKEVQKRIAEVLGRPAQEGVTGAGPARYYRLDGQKGTVGFINSISDTFCIGCNRLRLTSHGMIRPCLHYLKEFDLKSLLRSGGSEEEIRRVILKAVASKPPSHTIGKTHILRRQAQPPPPSPRLMSRIGG